MRLNACQNFFQLATILLALGRCALRQIMQFATHARQVGGVFQAN